MTNINSLNKTIGELEEKIARLNDFYAEQARILEKNRDSADYASIQSQSYREEELLTKELGGSLETFMKKISDITNKGLDDIEERLKRHSQTKFQAMREELEAEKEFIRENIEDKEKQYELLKKLEKEFNKERAKLILTQSQNLVGAIQNLVNAGEAQVNDIANTWAVINQGAHDYGRTVGLTAAQIENLNEKTLSFWSDNNIAYQFNVGLDEYYKIMSGYNRELGRAVGLTSSAMLNLVSMKNVLGEELAVKFTTNLDKFGLDVDATKELVEGIVGDARKSGIVLSNLTQNVADNLHLAQQYTFEDGVEGLVRMAEKATAVKWNMEQTAAFAEKVNNVEGAIKTGAQLSVLGGPFAQFSNPMGMLYESLNDMEGLQDRMFAMFGRMGQWNQEKGMLDISAFDKQRIRAAASAMGLNYGEVINNVNQQARRNVVMDQIKGYGLDENTTELIANTAQIDRETGRAYVMYNNEKVFANELEGRGDKNKILDYLQAQANSSDENLRDIARNTLGAKELAEAAVKEVMVDKADMYQYMNVTKDEFQSTVHVIEQTKAVLNQTNMFLNAIQSMVGLIANVVAFRGAFGRGSGSGMGSGGNNAGSPRGGAFGKPGSITDKKSMISQYGSASAARRAIRTNNIRTGVMAGGMAVSIGGMIAGQAMDVQADKLRERGLHGDADKVNIGSGIVGGAAKGASVGMMLGPWGALAGAIIGGAMGTISSINENKRDRSTRERNERIRAHYNYIYDNANVLLRGDYNEQELMAIRNGRSGVSGVLLRKMFEQGDGDAYNNLPPESFGRGGLVKGSTHANGGTIIEAENNEFIVNARSAQENLPLLNAINDNTVRPTQVMGEMLKVSSPGNTNHHMGFDNLNVNMNGGLQLSLEGYGMQPINSNELLSNPTFISNIRDEIIKQINYTTDKSFRKDNYYKKF